MNKSIINSYRLQPPPTQQPPTPGVIAGRIVPAVTSANYRRALVVLAVILLPLLAVGVMIYVAQATRPAPVTPPPPVVVEPTAIIIERVVEVTAPPVVVIVTVTPPPVQPVQVAPVAPRQAAPPPQTRPVQVQAPAVAPAARLAQSQPQAAPRSAPAPTMGPQERLLSRPCQFPAAPQGTIIQGYYTDASGRPRDAVCRADGWKATD